MPASDVYGDMRRMVLEIGPKDARAEPSAELPHVWAVIADWGVSGGSATFVALVDGTSSMYTSGGGGIIGGGGHQNVRAANRKLLLAAEAALEHLAPVDAATVPEPGVITYWVRTYEGLLSFSHAAAQPPVEPTVSALASAFQDFVYAIRVAGDQPRTSQSR